MIMFDSFPYTDANIHKTKCNKITMPCSEIFMEITFFILYLWSGRMIPTVHYIHLQCCY